MADPNIADAPRYLPPAPSAKKPGAGVSSSWVVMVLAGLIAVVIFIYATQQGAERFSVSVVTTRLSPGQALSTANIAQTQVAVPAAQLEKLITLRELKNYEGWIVTSTLDSGDLLSKSDLSKPSGADGLRAMSIPINPERAVAGELEAGDRVDLVDTSGAFPSNFAARNLQILSVKNGAAGGLGGGGNFSITVGVTAEDAVSISRALGGGKFDIVRSTGAAPIVISPAPTRAS